MVHQSDLNVSSLSGSPPPLPPHPPFFYCIGIVLGGEANIGKSQNGPILGRQYNTNTVSPSLAREVSLEGPPSRRIPLRILPRGSSLKRDPSRIPLEEIYNNIICIM